VQWETVLQSEHTH